MAVARAVEASSVAQAKRMGPVGAANQLKKMKKPHPIVGARKVGDEMEMKKEMKIDQCRARRADLLEAKKQRVIDLRNKKVVKKTVPPVSVQKEEKQVVPLLVQPQPAVKKAADVAPVVPAPAITEMVSVPVSVINLGFEQGFEAMYELVGVIKRGGFGVVVKARSRADPQAPLLAVKSIQKSKITEEMAVSIKEEVGILAALNGHANTVQFYGAFEDQHYVYIVMELIEGGDMAHQHKMRGYACDESTAKIWLHQLLAALQMLHANGIALRDVKLENVMFDKRGCLKMIDFGLSEYCQPGERLSGMAGTPGYIAPEVFEDCAGLESDLFSVGVLTYLLLTGEYPFPDGDDFDQDSWKLDPKLGPDYHDEALWGHISHEARHFIESLLHPDSSLRMTASQALAHKWLTCF